jgi:hypothetical protein
VRRCAASRREGAVDGLCKNQIRGNLMDWVGTWFRVPQSLGFRSFRRRAPVRCHSRMCECLACKSRGRLRDRRLHIYFDVTEQYHKSTEGAGTKQIPTPHTTHTPHATPHGPSLTQQLQPPRPPLMSAATPPPPASYLLPSMKMMFCSLGDSVDLSA